MNYEKIINERAAIIQEVIMPDENKGIKVYIKREDLLHPEISGNKWRKLKYNLIYAKENNYNTLLTFGGAYSNHIFAVASAGKNFGFNTIGIIRGEEHLPLNPTLQFAKNCGMKLNYLNRTTYKNRDDINFRNKLADSFGNPYVIPEGGTNLLAIRGVAEMTAEIDFDYDYICVANGTGGTIAGIISYLMGNKYVLGFPSLKGGEFLYTVINNLVKDYTGNVFTNYKLITDYHFGGYAKINYELITFINKFQEINKIMIDPVYTGKMFYGINNLIKNNYFKKDTKILAIHTGGLQGVAGMQEKIAKLLKQKA